MGHVDPVGLPDLTVNGKPADRRAITAGGAGRGPAHAARPGVVTDLAAAKAVYTALLGVPPEHDAPYYVGYEAAGQHIGLVPGGAAQGMTTPVTYWHVPDIEAKLAEVTAAGATVKDAPRDVGFGRVVATFTDPDGNVLGLLEDR